MPKPLDTPREKYTVESFRNMLESLESPGAQDRLERMKRFWGGEKFETVFGFDMELVAHDCKGSHRDIAQMLSKPGAVKGLGNPFLNVLMCEFLPYMNEDEISYDEVLNQVLRSGYGLSIDHSGQGNYFAEERVNQMPFSTETPMLDERRPIVRHEINVPDYAAALASLPRQLHQGELLKAIGQVREDKTALLAHSIVGHLVRSYHERGRPYHITNIQEIQNEIIATGQTSAFMQLARWSARPEYHSFVKSLGLNHDQIAAALPPIERAYYMCGLVEFFPGREQEIADLCIKYRVHSRLIDAIRQGRFPGVDAQSVVQQMQKIEMDVEGERGERYENNDWGFSASTFLATLAEGQVFPGMTQSERFAEIVDKRKGHAVLVINHEYNFRDLPRQDIVRAAKQAIDEGDGDAVLRSLDRLPRAARKELLMAGGGVNAVLKAVKKGEVLVDADIAEQVIAVYERDRNKDTRASVAYLATHLHALDSLTNDEQMVVAQRLLRNGFSQEIFNGFLKDWKKDDIVTFLVQSEAWQGLAVLEGASAKKIEYAEHIATAFELPEPFVRRMLTEQNTRSHLFFDRFLGADPHYRALYRKCLEQNEGMVVSSEILDRFEGNARIEKALHEAGINVAAWKQGLESEDSTISGASADFLIESAIEARETADLFDQKSEIWSSITSFLEDGRGVEFEDPKVLGDIQNISQQILKLEERIEVEAEESKRAGQQKALEQLLTKRAELQKRVVRKAVGELSGIVQDLKTGLGNLHQVTDANSALYEKWKTTRRIFFAGHEGGALMPDQEMAVESEWKKWLGAFTPEVKLGIEKETKALKAIVRPLQRIQTLAAQCGAHESTLSLQAAVSETLQRIQNTASQFEILASSPEVAQKSVYSRTSGRDLVNDIFDGNNTVCCLSVDNKVHPDGIPLLDYMADVGMHVLQLGETTGNRRPKNCGWLWIGKSKKSGEVALVIDNDEGAPDFAASYRKEMGGLVFKRVKQLAERVGIKKVVIGRIHNDIPVGDLELDDGMYEKLGGFVHEEMIGSKRKPRGILHLEALNRPVLKV